MQNWESEVEQKEIWRENVETTSYWRWKWGVRFKLQKLVGCLVTCVDGQWDLFYALGKEAARTFERWWRCSLLFLLRFLTGGASQHRAVKCRYGFIYKTCQKRCLPSKVALPVLCKRSSMGVNGLADCYSRIFTINQAARIKALGRRFLCQLRARTPEECIDLSIQHSTACILCHVALYLETNLHSDFSAFLSDGQLYEHSLLVLVSSMSINCDVSFLLCRVIFKSSIKQCRLSPSI